MPTASQPAPPQSPKRKLIRRTLPDRSQRMRHWVQALFVALNLWLGLQFFLWVRSFQIPGSLQVSRPPGAEGWLPIAGLMNFKYFLFTRTHSRHPSRRHVPLHGFRTHEPAAQKGLLLLALPRGNAL